MKCLNFEDYMRYLDSELTQKEAEKLEQHLHVCPFCQQQFHEYQQEYLIMDGFLQVDDLPETFTQDIIAKLPIGYYEWNKEKTIQEKILNTLWRGSILKKITVTAASLAAIISLGTFISPTFAEYVKETLFKASENVDKGIETAAKDGFVNVVDKEVTDQGITLKVREVLADPYRIVTTYEVMKGGTALEVKDFFASTDVGDEINKFYLTDDKGKVVKERFNIGDSNRIVFELIDSDNPEGILPDNLIMHVEINQLDNNKGKWHLEIPIDMLKAKSATKSYPVNKSYTNKDGVEIKVQKIAFAPSGTIIQLETKHTKERADFITKMKEQRGQKDKAFLFKHAQFDYIIKNDKGEVVANTSGADKDSITNKSGYNKKEDTYISYNAFLPFSNQEKLTLEATSISYDEPIDYAISFKPSDLDKKKVTKPLYDSVVTVNKAYLTDSVNGFLDTKKELVEKNGGLILFGEKNEEERKAIEKGVIIELDHTDPKDTLLTNQSWKVKDEQGNIHRAAMAYYITTKPNGEKVAHYILGVKELKQIPNELSLILDETLVEDRNINWKVPLTN